MAGYPLLTKVLDGASRKAYGGTGVGLPFHEAIPPDIADALERALAQGCSRCPHPRSSHDTGWDAAGCMVGDCHCPFVPLVTP